MRRAIFSRIGAVCAALWLGVTVAEPLAMRDCQMHGGTPEPNAAPASGVAAHAHDGTATHRDHKHDSHHHCSCVGPCCAGTAAERPALVAAPLFDVLATAARRAARANLARRPAEPEHARPPSIGPPARFA